jgi:excisionase family DNA binding protein
MAKEYTIKEVAEMKEVSPSTIRRRIKNGDLKAEKRKSRYGNTYFIPAEELDKAVMEQEVVEFKNKVEINKNELMNELIQALDSQNKELMEKSMDNIDEKLERQNEQIKEQNKAINKLTEKVEELKEEKNKSFIDKIKGIFS